VDMIVAGELPEPKPQPADLRDVGHTPTQPARLEIVEPAAKENPR
jgi:hypothetical protein